MPELPEVQTVVNELNRKLKNRTIKSVVVNAPKMVAVGPGVVSNIRRVKSSQVSKFIKLLQGHKIISVKRRAKLLIFDFSGPLSMLVHLKMTGQFIFEDKKLRELTGGEYRLLNRPTAPKVLLPSKHTHVIFSFTDGSTLYFNDIRKFGYIKLVSDNEIGQVRELKEYGPEPLEKKFTLEAFFAAIKKRARSPIKLALMDTKVVAGIGNIYSDEILFHAGVRPMRLVSSIKNQELREIYHNIKKVLKIAIKAKGSSVGDFVRTDGSWGQMGKFHFVYGRAKQKCKKCGTIIESLKLGGRTASFCPKCQK
ncbi:MAG: DNA-formamidopyrimidine glycosylase [Candidatus Doudnabacteria bacterium]|nr:DNA-formamidopyrimidine glycosylase [Candidatus Doudnabacteria bacterium]